ncbi:MAG TPA: NAD-dependent deacylase [Gemmatimonadetes bacterium]|nr:NAD-dependent deacylase [Gemmatimonadota bacterium]HIN78854.1 NAD-dependent deacylase [Gemmatimonadota bacterium]
MNEELEQAQTLLRAARSIVAVTGAGISAESGVPTFRGSKGLWKSYQPEELATPEAFARDPLTVWEWYGWRRGLIATCSPNSGHRALARLALSHPEVTIITQNVDGLHVRAAQEEAADIDPSPALPIELHGSIDRDRCSACDARQPGSQEIDITSIDTLPRCDRCSGLMRPDVVWFGEALDEMVLDRAFTLAHSADLCFVVGTSALVHPAASVPLATLHNGGKLIEINIQETALTPYASATLAAPAGSVLTTLLSGYDNSA